MASTDCIVVKRRERARFDTVHVFVLGMSAVKALWASRLPAALRFNPGERMCSQSAPESAPVSMAEID